MMPLGRCLMADGCSFAGARGPGGGLGPGDGPFFNGANLLGLGDVGPSIEFLAAQPAAQRPGWSHPTTLYHCSLSPLSATAYYVEREPLVTISPACIPSSRPASVRRRPTRLTGGNSFIHTISL